MSFPLMNKRPRQAVVVPELSGGINLRDSVSMIQDNQLTNAVNVWFQDGVLKTRPGICNMAPIIKEEWKNGDIKPHDIYNTISGAVYRLFSVKHSGGIGFLWLKNVEDADKDVCILPGIDVAEVDGINYFVIQKDENLYCFTSKKEIWKFEYLKETEKWEKLKEEELYAPLVMINCNTPAGNNTYEKESVSLLSGTNFEGYNAINRYYRMNYSTVNKDLFISEAYVQPAQYELLHWVEKDTTVTVKVTLPSTTDDGPSAIIKTREHSVKIDNPDGWNQEKYDENNPPEDGIFIKVLGKTLILCDVKNKELKLFEKTDFISENNMEITAPGPVADMKKIFNMTRPTWFGGAAEGINGGTRLFLGGNTSEANLVCWSDLNNPLYFPENNYFYVGESSSPVTAFGKQSDMLVIFKDNETYYTQYNRNTGITTEAVTSQSVIDVAASSAYFPLTLINANIGCDCPGTVELCRNRLVWTNSDGRIYTLVSNNQYSERNIFEIGEMIHRKLKTESNLKNARSVDWNGYYFLQTENRIYVLDYNSYGYQYVSSYSKNEDANLRIPCYCWEYELTAGQKSKDVLTSVDDVLLLITSGSYGIFIAELNEEQTCDNMVYSPDGSRDYQVTSQLIKSEMQTKLFEFGAQGYYKSVDKVVLSLGNNGGEPIKVSFVTDMGTEEETVTLESNETKPYSAGYVKSVQLSPCVRQVERFGVKLSCQGPLAVDGITLMYRITGGVR